MLHAIDRTRHYNRRLSVAMALALLLHATVFLLPVGTLRGWLGAGSGLGSTPAEGGLSPFMERALLGASVRVSLPVPVPTPVDDLAARPAVAATVETPVPVVEPQESDVRVAEDDLLPTDAIAPSAENSPSPEAAPASPGTTNGSELGTSHAQGGDAPGDGSPGGGILPVERALRPRILVQPRPPRDVMKRKIDDYVLLQALVGRDGRVLDVRVLRSIPNCEPCTENAVQAVRQYRYGPQNSEVWTTPFDLRFSYSR